MLKKEGGGVTLDTAETVTGVKTFSNGVGGDIIPAIDQNNNLGSTAKNWNYFYAFGLRSQVSGNNRFTWGGSSANMSIGEAPNSGTNTAHIFSNRNTLSGTTKIAEWHNDLAAATAEIVFHNDGSIEVMNIGAGFILKSPDGTRYRITVANGGALSTTAA